MIMKKAITKSIEKWTKHLDNENFGELIRAIMYYDKNKNIENLELSETTKMIMNKIFIKKLKSIEKESNRKKEYRKRKGVMKNGTAER